MNARLASNSSLCSSIVSVASIAMYCNYSCRCQAPINPTVFRPPRCMQGETDAKTAAALAAAIDAAVTYRPAVVLLSDMEALGDAAAGPAAGPAAAMAAALRLSGTLARGIAAGAPALQRQPLAVVTASVYLPSRLSLLACWAAVLHIVSEANSWNCTQTDDCSTKTPVNGDVVMCPLPFGPVFSGPHASKASPNCHCQVVQSACARCCNKLGMVGRRWRPQHQQGTWRRNCGDASATRWRWRRRTKGSGVCCWRRFLAVGDVH